MTTKLEGEACFINKTIHQTLENAGAKLVAISENNREFVYKRFISRAASCQTDEITIFLQKPLRWSIASKNDVTFEIGKRKEWQGYATFDIEKASDLAHFINYFADAPEKAA